MTSSNTRVSRRRFLQTATAAWAIPAMGFNHARATAPSERITVGIIGLGSRGFNLLDALLEKPDAQVVAICDVDSLHHRDRPWGKGMAYGREPAKQRIEKQYGSRAGLGMSRDFREVCSRDDIDAIVVATPDHWHALCTLEALRQGKDVYCEKPVTHTFHEGQLVYRQVAKPKAVFQTGSQQRSDPLFRRAVELVRNGLLGRIQRIEVGLPPGYDRPQGDVTVTAPPKHLDYNFWCGPSPRLPYMRARHHRWWRGHRAYGGGVLMDWIGHHNDIAHWALDLEESGPVKVEAVNWTYPDGDVYNTPHHYEIRCEYASGAKTSLSSRHPLGTKFLGEDGWLFVTRGRLQASDSRWTRQDFQPGSKQVYESDDHVRNFLDCVKSRKACIAPAETGHRSITPGHLGYVSQALGRSLKWNPEQEMVIGDKEANQLLNQHNYREPWRVSKAT
jgi:predicted dehydrogenase